MAPSPIPKELITYLSAASTTSDHACEAVEEWILSRRGRGDTLFEISVGLVELEEKTPPHLTAAFDRARYLTSLPEVTDLTPPSGVFPLHRSQSPATILAHLLGNPSPSLEHSREVILEYVLARETKARDKKPGKGGKGSLSREALEDISDRLTEVEQGLMHDRGHRLELDQLDESRQMGMTLVLSLRMSLSYFSLQELAKQLLKVPVGVGERILVQHIRRRVGGEGRWGVGKELEYLEGLTLQQRPALRPAFRSAKLRTMLPDQPLFPIQLPAPGKSSCIKLIQSFASESGVSPTSYFSRRGFAGSSPDTNSPRSPTSPLPLSPTSLPADPARLASLTQELVTEYLTREKREYMLKTKWARSGRDQLGKDLGEIEQALCLISKQQPSPLAPTLVPVFLSLRQTFLLPASPLPPKLVDAFIDLLQPSPDGDDVPFREPSIQTATNALYVNPRLNDSAAFEVLQELIVYEKEILDERGMGDGVPPALVQVLEHVQKRFPDGSYAPAFAKAKELARNNARPTQITKQPSMHRRAVSHFDAPTPPEPAEAEGAVSLARPRQHSRSASLPHRSNTMESESDSDKSIGIELTASHLTVDRPPVLPTLQTDQPPMLPPLSFASPLDGTATAPEPGSTSAGGWWDVVSAVQTHAPSAPWHDNVRSTTRKRTTSGGLSSLPVPPGAEPATIPQAEPLLAQLQSLERAIPEAVSRPASDPVTPARPSVQLPNDTASPPRASYSTAVDFSKRQSDASLNEELGNLMISNSRPPPPPIESPSRPLYTTPNGAPRHQSQSSTPVAGSRSRAYAGPPRMMQAQTMPRPLTSDSDDSDDEADLRRPMPPMISPNPRAMLQPSSRPTPPQQQGTPPNRPSPAGTPSSGGKPKSRGWKSVSAAMGISRDKEKVKENENEKVLRTANKAWPENDPGRWNKDMVANIMGPPADRR